MNAMELRFQISDAHDYSEIEKGVIPKHLITRIHDATRAGNGACDLGMDWRATVVGFHHIFPQHYSDLSSHCLTAVAVLTTLPMVRSTVDTR